jgi:hypothetical protein
VRYGSIIVKNYMEKAMISKNMPGDLRKLTKPLRKFGLRP